MKSHSVLEAWLRPPVEFWSALAAWGIALVALTAPWALMMSPWVGVCCAVITAAFGVTRFREGITVLRYQRGLKFYKITRVAPHKLPVTRDRLYLGEGFEWKQEHAQRKIDAQLKEVEPFVRPSLLERQLSGKGQGMRDWADQRAHQSAGWPRWSGRAVLQMLDAGGTANPFAPLIDLGGSAVLHGVGALDESPVALRQNQRNGHMLVMGTTRVGKTRLLEVLATQDIHAGHVTIVLDPKGDAELMLRMHAEARRAGREDQFYMFHLGYPDISARYNGIGSFSRITEVAARATNALPSSGNSAAFKEFSWRFTNIVAQAQVALGRIPTYETLLRDVTGIEPLFMEYALWYYANQAIGHGRFVDFKDKLDAIEAGVKAKRVQV